MLRPSAVLLAGACLLSVSATTLAAESVYDPLALFAPLQLPDPAGTIRGGGGQPGPMFWQNRADYRMAVTIDPTTQGMRGSETITYTNNSPDTLDVLWLQLDQNLYRADARGALLHPDWLTTHNDGIAIDAVYLEDDPGHTPLDILTDDTRLRVSPPQPLPGDGWTLKLHVDYHYTMPGTWGGRTGVTPTEKGDIYEVAQWYPRMAVYDDLRGWDTQPYLGSEFYLEYGDFDYAVTVPWDFLVVGSGELINPQEVLTRTQQARLKQATDSATTVMVRTPAEVGDPDSRPKNAGTLTWKFHMDHTRDVAFAASPVFVWDAARIDLPDDRHALAMSVYPPEGAGNWQRSTEYVKASIEHFSKWYPYPWPAAINLGGQGAGMEYPGIVFDGYQDTGKPLFWITAHELGHGWFPMIVGSNERRHAFMDEGFNTFIDVYASDAINGGEYAPKRDPEYAPDGGNPVDEILPVLADAQAPTLMATADTTSETYRHSVSYFKAALGLVLLREQILGPERFDPAFCKYIATWAYRHPTPSDFFRMMESEAGEDLSWWWRGWYFNNWQLDLAVTSVTYVDGDPAKGVSVTLASQQKLAMPATLRVDLADGSHLDRRVPVEAWMQAGTITLRLPSTAPVTRVAIDPDHVLPDGDRSNDSVMIGS